MLVREKVVFVHMLYDNIWHRVAKKKNLITVYSKMYPTKKIVAYLILCAYILSSNVFAHVQSMEMIQPATEIVMSDCGMMMEQPVDDVHHNCFEKCFGDYDDYHTTQLTADEHQIFISSVVDITHLYVSSTLPQETDTTRAPPDDRCIYQSVQMPYFSHSDMIKVE